MVMYMYIAQHELKIPKNPSDYIGIKGTRFMIEREPSHNGLEFDAADLSLRQEGLFMPSPAIFMPYRNKVIKAAAGDVRLYDGAEKKLTRKSVQEIAGKLTKGCRSWLYARFAEDSNGRFQITYNRIKDADTIEEVTEKLQLSEGIRIQNSTFVDIAFNRQGMPVRMSGKQEFDAQKNLYFHVPVDGSVAGFYSRADWASLCYWGPRGSSGGLGTFACAAGAQRF